MTDLKPCPWCNKEPFSDTNGGFWCNDCAGTKSEKDWNSRPIEDRMRAALERAVSYLHAFDRRLADDCREALK